MIFSRTSLLTRLEVWFPRYNDKTHGKGEWRVLLAQYKVDQASPWILIEFTKAKHLKGQRFCIKRSVAQAAELDTNGKIPCYSVKMSDLEHWDTVDEIKKVALSLFPN